MKNKFDYYIHVDYSENLIGYTIIEASKVSELLLKVSKLHHYRKIRHKKEYLSSMKKRFEREDIRNFLLRWKISEMRLNLNIFVDVIDFVKKHDDCVIFVSVDDKQYHAFLKLIGILFHKKCLVVRKESELKKGSLEYSLSLIVDTMLNLERRKLK